MLKVAGGGITGAVVYQGTWNASTNTPTLVSSVGTQGYYYVVSVAGSTNLNGITDWQVGDWAIFNGSVWQKVDNTDAVASFSAGTTGFTPSTATTGAITLAGTLVAANGGTGQSTYAVGDLLYASTTSALSKLADVATGNSLISGGVGVAPSWGKIGLTTHVSGTLPTANGGTNLTTFTSGGAVYATSTSVLTTGTLPATAGGTGNASFAVGDLLYASTTTALSKLADVATGNALISGGVGVAPSYGKIGLTTHVSGTLPIANGGTALTTTPTNGQLLIGNGTNYTLATLTQGTGISVTNASGAITIANSNTLFWSSKTAAYTITSSDFIVFASAASGAYSVTLPTAVGASGKNYIIKKIDNSANVVTVATTSSQTIDGQPNYLLSLQWNGVNVVSDGVNWLILGVIPGRNGTAGTF